MVGRKRSPVAQSGPRQRPADRRRAGAPMSTKSWRYLTKPDIAAGDREKASLCRINHLALDIFIILLVSVYASGKAGLDWCTGPQGTPHRGLRVEAR